MSFFRLIRRARCCTSVLLAALLLIATSVPANDETDAAQRLRSVLERSDAAIPDADQKSLAERLDREIADLNEQIAKQPKSINGYSTRGDRLFFRARFKESVEDFEKMVALDPTLETSHWRRGIAYFYADEFEKGAHQFEIYHSFDNVDRENGIWRYLCQVKSVGRDEARKGLLKYEKDDRPPFADVYKLFAGQITGQEIIDSIRKAKLTATERDQQLFYAQLYIGLNAAVDGEAIVAEYHLREATRNTWGSKAGGGPGWMWNVGRVHYDRLRAERLMKAPEKSAPGR